MFAVFPKNGLFARPEGRLGRYSPNDEDLITKFAQLFPFGNAAPVLARRDLSSSPGQEANLGLAMMPASSRRPGRDRLQG
jgi:hypothetical protein